MLDTDQHEHPSLADAVEPRALAGLDQPLWLQNSSYPAALDRLLIASAFPHPGIRGAGSFAVTQRGAGANMSVDVAAGTAVVGMTDTPNQGYALCRSTAVNNLPIAGAPAAGLTRIDRIVARVYDASLIGGSINGWQLEVVTGTAASSPSAPALPASCLPLARVTVAAGAASITNALIIDERLRTPFRADIDLSGKTVGHFTNIPPGYSALRLSVRARSTAAGYLESLAVRINDLATNNYLWSVVSTNNGAVVPSQPPAQTYGYLGWVPCASLAPSGHMSISETDFPDYDSSTVTLGYVGQSTCLGGTIAESTYHASIGVLYTASGPINKLSINTISGSAFAAGSKVTLYGVAPQ